MKRFLVIFVLLLEVMFGSETWSYATSNNIGSSIAVQDDNGYDVAYVVDNDNKGYLSVFGDEMVDLYGIVDVPMFLNVSSLDETESYDFNVQACSLSDTNYFAATADVYDEISSILKASNKVSITIYNASGTIVYNAHVSGKGFTRAYNSILN